ncbi:hypothetical protein EES43_10975 [Streptomyces sp. ADI96-02]|nr:hypothetical protein EES43_10975 [Streptomyces sp. ADI96-02]
MINPYTYATGDPVNYTDPTGQSSEGSWDWLTEDILGWKYLPAVEVGIAAAGLALALATFTGGSGIPLAIAGIGFLTTLPSAADQITANTSATGEGFMPKEARMTLDVIGLVGAGVDAAIGIGYAAHKGYKTYQAAKAANALPIESAAPARVAAGSSAAGKKAKSAFVSPSWEDLKKDAFDKINNATPGMISPPVEGVEHADVLFDANIPIHKALKEKNEQLVVTWAFQQKQMINTGNMTPNTLMANKEFQTLLMDTVGGEYQNLYYKFSTEGLGLKPNQFPHVNFVDTDGNMVMNSHFAAPRNNDSPWHAAADDILRLSSN